MSKTFPKKIDRNFDVRFLFIAFSGVSQQWEFKNTTKNRVERFLQENREKSQTDFSRFFITCLGVLPVRGVQKHHKKYVYENINLTLVLFRPLTHPPTTGSPGFCFGGPMRRYNTFYGLISPSTRMAPTRMAPSAAEKKAQQKRKSVGRFLPGFLWALFFFFF
jgi:hypothetical protein